MEFGFSTLCSLDLDGAVAVISEDTIDRYTGAVDGVPQTLNVRLNARAAHATPNPEPRLMWNADSPTSHVNVGLATMKMDGWGIGLTADLLDVPEVFGFDWMLLGDGFTGIKVIGAPGRDRARGRRRRRSAGRAVKLGGVSPPTGWPDGEATVGIDLAQERRTKHGGHPHPVIHIDPGWWRINARGLRFAQLRLGDVEDPVANAGRMRGLAVIGDDPDDPPGGDRDLRVRFRAATGVLDHVLARARELPDRVEVDAFLSDHTDGGTEYSLIAQLASRLRYVRAAAVLRNVMEVSSATVTGEVDDTGDALVIRMSARTTGRSPSRASNVSGCAPTCAGCR